MVTYLRQSDFATGTYRITESGEYRLAENIYFNPNPDNDWQPLPNDSRYTGPEYQLGFFAAITIEVEDVVLDLRGHKIAQSKAHALQQRFFAVIELANSPFIPAQGPADFTQSLQSAQRVTVKNGTIGLSSHHGIHGNGMSQVVLRDLCIRDFEVAAVALNGGEDHSLMNLKVGPSRQDVPILGTYSAGRFIRPFLRSLVAQGGELGAEASQVLKTLEDSLNRTFKEIECKGKTSDPLYANMERNTDGNVYGILFNPLGVAVEGLLDEDPASGYTKNVHMDNVEIHNLKASVKEVVVMSKADGSGAMNDPVGAVFRIDWWSDEQGKYIPNPLADAMLFLAEHRQSLPSAGKMSMTADLVAWSKGELSIQEMLEKGYRYKCNGDSMFHVNKGILALRIDGVQDAEVKHLKIHSIRNKGLMGNQTLGGPYAQSHDAQSQVGYNGCDTRAVSINHSHGVHLHRATIKGIVSEHGIASGVDVMYGCQDVCLNRVEIRDLQAGSKKCGKWMGKGPDGSDREYTAELPNLVPVAYGVKISNDCNEVDIRRENIKVNSFKSVKCPSGITVTVSGI